MKHEQKNLEQLQMLVYIQGLRGCRYCSPALLYRALRTRVLSLTDIFLSPTGRDLAFLQLDLLLT